MGKVASQENLWVVELFIQVSQCESGKLKMGSEKKRREGEEDGGGGAVAAEG